MSATDPRAAVSTVTGGPPSMLGPVVACERVTIAGTLVDVPRPHAGVPEYIAVAQAEKRAEELRPFLLRELDTRGAVPYQPSMGLVFDMRAAAGTAVTSAIAGLEAFANHHLHNACPPGQTVTFRGDGFDLERLWNLPLNERYSEALPGLAGTPSPTGEVWWPKFRQVQRLAAHVRHGITAPAGGPGLVGTVSISERLYNGEYLGAASMMLGAFEFVSPGWIAPGVASYVQSLVA